MLLLFMSNDYPYAAFAAHMHTRQMAAVLSSIEQLRGNADLLRVTPRLLLQAVVIPGDKTKEGQLSVGWRGGTRLLAIGISLKHEATRRRQNNLQGRGSLRRFHL